MVIVLKSGEMSLVPYKEKKAIQLLWYFYRLYDRAIDSLDAC